MGKAPHSLDSWPAADAGESETVGTSASGDPSATFIDSDEPPGSEVPAVLAPHDDPLPWLPPRKARDLALAALFGVLAIGWIGLWLMLWIGQETLPVASATAIADFVTAAALASGPLALLGIAYMLVQRGTRGEVRRFGATAMSMRVESHRLEDVVTRLTETLDRRRRDLADHAASLLDEGNRAAERLQQIRMDMRNESDLLTRQTAMLRDAAEVARSGLGGLIQDLPRSLEMVGEVGERVSSIGSSTRDHAEALSTTLSAIITRSHEADQLIGAASGRLTTQIGRIESRTERTARAIEEAAAGLGATVDATLDRTTSALEQSRASLDLQRQAMVAMIDHGRAALDEAGTAAATSLADRMIEMGRLADALSAQLSRQDGDTKRLVEDLEQALISLEHRFQALGATGTEQTADLAEIVLTLSEHVDLLSRAVTDGLTGARSLADQADGLRAAFHAIIANVDRDLPHTMQRVESEAARGDAAMRAITSQAEQLVQTIDRATERLGSADMMIVRQRGAIASLSDEAAYRMTDIATRGDALLERQRALSDAFAEEANARLEALRDHANELGRLIGATETNIRSLSELAGSGLIDAILHVRDTADEAARGARAALESIIPAAGEQLATSGAEAIERAFGDEVTRRIHLISDAAEAAVAAANLASEKLLQQMLAIADATVKVEKRVAEAQAQQEQMADHQVAREVAILIEHLNSAAVDVTRLMSHDVPEGAWRAYLHGDNGAFTRTAVRLLRQEEATLIAGLYDSNVDFRDHVNRYIHDFEALLRRILHSRDGGALAVTMISSDMGKLYVALAQAIQRLAL